MPRRIAKYDAREWAKEIYFYLRAKKYFTISDLPPEHQNVHMIRVAHMHGYFKRVSREHGKQGRSIWEVDTKKCLREGKV